MPETAAKPPANAPEAVDQDALSLQELASAILAGSLRPRVNSLRRLAEAVLADQQKPAKKKKKSSSGSKGSNKKRKLAKIPGQKKDQQKGK